MTATTTILSDSSGGAGGGAAAMPRVAGVRTRKITFVDFNISSYTTGGEVLPTAAALNMQEITAVFPILRGTSVTTLNPVLRWDSTNGKLICVGDVTVATQTANAVNLGSVYLMVLGY